MLLAVDDTSLIALSHRLFLACPFIGCLETVSDIRYTDSHEKMEIKNMFLFKIVICAFYFHM